jgi:hypothetical protein
MSHQDDSGSVEEDDAVPTGGHVLINETLSARWFVYRQESPLDPTIDWSEWDVVRDGARGADGDLAGLLERNHARAVTAILDQSDWTGRGVHHCGTVPYPRPDSYVLVYAVHTEPQTVYYASPIPLPWMQASVAAPP